ERVIAKVKPGEMPPAGLPRPDKAEADSVVSWLEAEFARQDAAIVPLAGRVTARRLNRNEYNNTIRDLLAVEMQPAADFPADEAAYGFDNNADALNLSPVLMEKYFDAAERAVRAAIFGPRVLQAAAVHYPLPVRINILAGTKHELPDLTHYDRTGLSTIHAAHVVHRFPVDGEYSFNIVLNGHRPNGSEPVQPALYIDGKFIGDGMVDATDLEGQSILVRTNVTAGDHLLSTTYHNVYSGLPPSYGGPEPSTREAITLTSERGKPLNEADLELLRKYGTRIKTDRSETRIDPRFESIDVGGPFTQTTEPSAESLSKVFVCSEETDACARQIVSGFAGSALRRPATEAEVDSFLKFVGLAQKHGDSFEEGIATALQAILVSPHFLYRIEQERPASASSAMAPLSDYELASRLSYFLWSSTPDDELLRLADEGRLRQPTVLEAQVHRMLRDPKSAELVKNFGGQWLQLANIDVVRPDFRKFPEWEDSLRASMRQETELFLGNIVQQDRSVLEMLDADYTFMNERLARFYGVEGVTGLEFRKVSMTGTQRGGGLLAQASLLTVSSYSTRTSPVLRGKWILENLLNQPPPPPPPGVPPLNEASVGESVSLRQEMETHRANAVCASCHSRMDPLGFGLENFNAIGAWRATDGKLPVDASGTLPDGTSFEGAEELKSILLNEKTDFVDCLSEKLLIYALGRGLERYDRPALTKISGGLTAGDYRFSELILSIVNSLPFQMTSGNQDATLALDRERP
ncbi:MAG: DUF1592 domain-containing protein, partial [Acidobacteria bacterium]|nr:DUF1592 domain-containing protein [Acidobacteriota bacterium]